MVAQVFTVQRDSTLASYFVSAGNMHSPYFSHYGGTLCPESRFKDKALAELVATFCNLAYAAGQDSAKREVRKSLGL